MFNKSLIRVYFNEHIRCYYDGTIERFQTKRGNRTLIKPYWKIIKNVGHKPDGYNKIGINDKMYLRQRIIAFCYYGSFELDDVSVDVDHRDGNTINNCVENLKVGTHRQNCLNRKDAKNYSLVKNTNSWMVSVSIHGKKYYGGLFKIGEEEQRDIKIKEMKDKYHKHPYESTINAASEHDLNIKDYPFTVEQLQKKIKELEFDLITIKYVNKKLTEQIDGIDIPSNQKFVCDVCMRPFQSNRSLAAHMKVHKDKSVKEINIIQSIA